MAELREVQCDLCGKTFMTQQGLSGHKRGKPCLGIPKPSPVLGEKSCQSCASRTTGNIACGIEVSCKANGYRFYRSSLPPVLGETVLTGIDLIAKERLRQIEKEGWDDWHDDVQTDGALAIAGAVYAIDLISNYPKLRGEWSDKYHKVAREFWPYHDHWFKPTWQDPVKQLAKAGALIAAEIDRLQRIGKEG